MHKLIISAAVAAAAGLAAPGQAAAGGDIVVNKPTSKTGISGRSGAEKYLGWKPRANKWFYAIGWSERKDRPCFMRLYGMGYEDGELSFGHHKLNVINYPVLGPHRTLRLCKWKPTSGKVVGAALAKDKVARVITALRVCTSKRAIGLRVMKTSQGVRGLGLVCAPFSKAGEKTKRWDR